MAQPNLELLGQHLVGVGNQVPLLANLPAVNQGATEAFLQGMERRIFRRIARLERNQHVQTELLIRQSERRTKNRIARVGRRIDEANRRIDELGHRIDELGRQIEDNTDRIRETNAWIDKTNCRIDDTNDLIDENTGRIRENNHGIDDINYRIDHINHETGETNRQITALIKANRVNGDIAHARYQNQFASQNNGLLTALPLPNGDPFPENLFPVTYRELSQLADQPLTQLLRLYELPVLPVISLDHKLELLCRHCGIL
ncbi:unnamed protein product [Rhizoctonia solani]|uniref:t-SNARE coiled-coil homology domain-containing protein n=1 Tax=Rhizoctonia solani TaxID=456999 RepID=A0A8H3CWX1_9AGAM|nr:unnamed protein product [Rhizoctonia solani]